MTWWSEQKAVRDAEQQEREEQAVGRLLLGYVLISGIFVALIIGFLFYTGELGASIVSFFKSLIGVS